MKEECRKIGEMIKKTISKIKFDEKFTVMNDGKSYNLGNDSKIISKIYQMCIDKRIERNITYRKIRIHRK